MSEKIKKVSRESELRAKEIRKKPWTPPSSLDAPPPPAGFVHRWLSCGSETGNHKRAQQKVKVECGRGMVLQRLQCRIHLVFHDQLAVDRARDRQCDI